MKQQHRQDAAADPIGRRVLCATRWTDGDIGSQAAKVASEWEKRAYAKRAETYRQRLAQACP